MSIKDIIIKLTSISKELYRISIDLRDLFSELRLMSALEPTRIIEKTYKELIQAIRLLDKIR